MTGKINSVSNIITVRQGDSYDLYFQFRTSCGTPIDMTNSVIKMQAVNESEEPVLTKTAETIDIKKGLFCLTLTPSETNIDVGDYQTDIQFQMPDGRINTFFPSDVNKVGILRITKQITK